MNIIEKEMDAYEISEEIFNNNNITSNFTIHNTDLINYFEMLLIITTEGLKKFFSKNNKINIEELSYNDIEKINTFLKKINIKINFKFFNNIEWNNNAKKIIPYNKILINNNTNLEELCYIIYSISNIYVINFSFIL